MTAEAASRQHKAVKIHPLYSGVSTVLIAVGMTGWFAPMVLERLLPAGLSRWLIEAAGALLAAGIALTVYGIVRTVVAAKKAADGRPEAAAAEAAGAMPAMPGADTPAGPVDWSPLKGGGANFRTHILVDNARGRIEIRPTRTMQALCWLLIVIGAGVGAGGGYLVYVNESAPAALIPVLAGTVFLGVGLAMRHFAAMPRVFDLQVGWYWKGRGKGQRPQAVQHLKEAAPLSQVEGIQLLAEYCRGDKSSYYSYELNLVLKDGRRLNVMDHGDKAQLTADAGKLAGLLNVPVWNRM